MTGPSRSAILRDLAEHADEIRTLEARLSSLKGERDGLLSRAVDGGVEPARVAQAMSTTVAVIHGHLHRLRRRS